METLESEFNAKLQINTNYKTTGSLGKEKKFTYFTSFEKQIKLPFVYYVEFELLRIPYNDPKQKNVVLVHKPCAFSYVRKCSYDHSLTKYETYYGENCVDVFWKLLEEDIREIKELMKKKEPPHELTKQQRSEYRRATECYYCYGELGSDKHEDYFEVTGEYLGAAHEKCKVKKKNQQFIPIILDDISHKVHFLCKNQNPQLIYSIKDDKNSYIAFIKTMKDFKLRFIDAGKFLINYKIDELEKLLDDHQKSNIRRVFKKRSEFNLMKTKGCFPYFYIISLDQFSEEKLPNRIGFYDQILDEAVSDDDYNWAQQVWTMFKCQTVSDYFELYIKSKLLLFEAVFENFRSLCLNKYKLDPVYYYTVSSYSWDAMLLYTRVELELMQDTEMINLIKSSIRGGILHCSKRYAKSNNKYCPTFDATKPSSFIIYLDANNLGGWAMSQHLPFGNFSWLSNEEVKEFSKAKLFSLESDSDFGYILEVDLEYPTDLHDLHNDLPFCCDHIKLPYVNKLSNCDKKPALTLYNKSHYVIDYRNLKQCLENGLHLTKIHRVLKFSQSQWLQPYIQYNTDLRTNATNDFEIALYKMFNNSVYGKTIQKNSKDKPIYAGFCILELSKNFMYNFHYNIMLPKYKQRINLLYTDTDAFLYEIYTKDFFCDLKRDQIFLDFFDTSGMVERWKIPSRNKKVLGKMKDECNGRVIYEYFGVGSKFYCYEVEGEVVKKAAGVPKFVKAKYVTKSDYAKCVLENKKIVKKYFSTELSNCHGFDHEIVTVETTRTVLSPGDTKRIVMADKINTLAWGHYSFK